MIQAITKNQVNHLIKNPGEFETKGQLVSNLSNVKNTTVIDGKKKQIKHKDFIIALNKDLAYQLRCDDQNGKTEYVRRALAFMAEAHQSKRANGDENGQYTFYLTNDIGISKQEFKQALQDLFKGDEAEHLNDVIELNEIKPIRKVFRNVFKKDLNSVSNKIRSIANKKFEIYKNDNESSESSSFFSASSPIPVYLSVLTENNSDNNFEVYQLQQNRIKIETSSVEKLDETELEEDIPFYPEPHAFRLRVKPEEFYRLLEKYNVMSLGNEHDQDDRSTVSRRSSIISSPESLINEDFIDLSTPATTRRQPNVGEPGLTPAGQGTPITTATPLPSTSRAPATGIAHQNINSSSNEEFEESINASLANIRRDLLDFKQNQNEDMKTRVDHVAQGIAAAFSYSVGQSKFEFKINNINTNQIDELINNVNGFKNTNNDQFNDLLDATLKILNKIKSYKKNSQQRF